MFFKATSQVKSPCSLAGKLRKIVMCSLGWVNADLFQDKPIFTRRVLDSYLLKFVVMSGE